MDVERLRHGLALLDSVAAVMAAGLLGDPNWPADDELIQVAVLRSVDAAGWHVARAVSA